MTVDSATGMTVQRLAEFGEAWHQKDLDKLLKFITDDCVYSASVGPEPGETFRGRDEVREGFARMLAYDTGAERHSDDAWIFGERGVALWSFGYKDDEGNAYEVKGIDLYTFVGDKISLKDAYRKTFPAPADE
jgi:taurine dehydrogenase small subunit